MNNKKHLYNNKSKVKNFFIYYKKDTEIVYNELINKLQFSSTVILNYFS